MNSYFKASKDFVLYKGDCREIIPRLLNVTFDMVFADPPYFLSNDGFTIQSGQKVSVNKGDWDRTKGLLGNAEFNYQWIRACREKMSDAATIWVCGTFHNIYSVATALTDLDFRILNAVTWQKTNPPPNLSCRFFTHSTEILLWARKNKKVPHCFNYDLMHRLAGNRQMTDVWRMPAIGRWEKMYGKHPTQKPLALVIRALLASTKEGALVLDPFAGSSTTGIAANLVGRRFVGIESDDEFLKMSKARRMALGAEREGWVKRIPDLALIRKFKSKY